MASEKFANKISTTVDSAYTAGSGSLVVADATGMPTTGNFRVRLGNTAGSILRVTARSGTTLTVDVEQDDGNASVGDTVTLVGTAGAMLALKKDAGSRVFATTAAVPTATTSAETLFSYTLPGGTLANNGDSIRIVAWIKFAANNNNKSVALKFGSTVLLGTGQAGFNNSDIIFICDVVRTGATAQISSGLTYFAADVAPSDVGGANIIGTVNGNCGFTAPAETLSGNITIALRALSPSAAGDITGRSMSVDFYPAP